MILVRHATKSLISRWVTVGLTIFVIALSVMLILGVEKIRNGARQSFADTISNTDLIVGARSGSIQLLLYSVFRIGDATNNTSWKTYKDISDHPEVKWTVPISLGDSHRGFRVMGTTADYFTYYQYRSGKKLRLAHGNSLDDLFDTVIGADVAEQLNYQIGDPIIVSHGLASFSDHDDRPFQVSGILEKTGTPVDRTVIVSLRAIEAIHIDWQSGAKTSSSLTVDEIRQMKLEPKSITAFMVGMNSRLKIFSFQRYVNEYPEEAMLAILPGVALQELWNIVGLAEKALAGVSILVVATSILSMAAMMLAGLNQRRREMAILRALGATPMTIALFLSIEAVIMSFVAVIVGIALLYISLFIAQPIIDTQFGIFIPLTGLTVDDILIMCAVIFAGFFVSLIPSYRAYRMTLSDGMSIRH